MSRSDRHAVATRKKKRTRAPVLKDLTREELLEIVKENDKTNEEIRKIMAKTKPTMDEIRKAIEEAISDLEEVGEFHMMFEGEEYVIRLSQNVKGQIRYDPDSRQIIIVLPDNSLWRRGPNGRWDKRSMDIHINAIVQLHEARQQIHWCEGEMERLHRESLPNSNTMKYRNVDRTKPPIAWSPPATRCPAADPPTSAMRHATRCLH